MLGLKILHHTNADRFLVYLWLLHFWTNRPRPMSPSIELTWTVISGTVLNLIHRWEKWSIMTPSLDFDNESLISESFVNRAWIHEIKTRERHLQQLKWDPKRSKTIRTLCNLFNFPNSSPNFQAAMTDNNSTRLPGWHANPWNDENTNDTLTRGKWV